MATKTVPTRNYFILVGMIVLIITACFAIFNIYNIYQESKITKSVLAKNSVKFEDLSEITKEMSADTFLIVGYTQNNKIYQNEKEIKQLLNKNNLLDNVLYLDATDKMIEENFIEELNNTLELENNNKITSIPAIVFYSNNEVTYVKSGSVTKDDIAQIIDMYNLAS
jgi:hypothetical protein